MKKIADKIEDRIQVIICLKYIYISLCVCLGEDAICRPWAGALARVGQNVGCQV